MAKAKKTGLSRIMTIARELHEARVACTQAETAVIEKEAAFQKRYTGLYEGLTKAQERRVEAEAKLRAKVLEYYEETGQTAIGPGLEVRMLTSVKVEDSDSLEEWARANAPWLLKIHMPLVNRLAKAFPDLIPGVVEEETPTAAIAKDLGKALAEMTRGGRR